MSGSFFEDETQPAAAGESYALIQEQYTPAAHAGTFTSGAWRTRVLNTKVSDASSIASLASNQVTLQAGTYRIKAHAPAYHVGAHQVRIRNVTDGSTVANGTNETHGSHADPPATRSFVDTGWFTIASAKAFELQHRCASTQATSGLGSSINFDLEVFAVLEVWKQ